MWGKGTSGLLVVATFSTLLLLWGTSFAGFSWLIVPMVLLTGFFASALSRAAPAYRFVLPVLLVLAASFAVVSLLTGLLNGFSDEPYSTPAYASNGLGIYTHPISFSYVQYGRTYFERSYDVYLPVLTFVQVPGLDYRWISLAAWAGTAYLVRKDPFVLGGIATPWIPILAANGQNDFVPLLALTVALVVRPTSGRWGWEVLSLGLKQFANVIVFLYHLARREYVLAAGAVAATLAILAPFIAVNPGAVWCHVVLGDPGSTCRTHPWTYFVFKRNYWLYPTWVGLVFHARVGPLLRRLAHGLRPSRSAPRSSKGETDREPVASPRP